MTPGWRMARGPGARRVAMRWIRKQNDNNNEQENDHADQQEASDPEDERNQDGTSGSSLDQGGSSRTRGSERREPGPSIRMHVRQPSIQPAMTLAPLQPAAPQMNLSAAVAACVASSYGAVPAKEMDPDETTQPVTVCERTRR